jgi:hypothetical protein
MTDLGAPDPEGWVKSEIEENIPQVARFLVLRTMWTRLINGYIGDTSWLERWAARAEARPHEPFADAGHAIRRMLAAGAAPEDLTQFARAVAYEAVFGTIEIIDEGYDPDLIDPGNLAPGWVLIENDTEGQPTHRQVGGLHESLLSLDPSGREGSPA